MALLFLGSMFRSLLAFGVRPWLTFGPQKPLRGGPWAYLGGHEGSWRCSGRLWEFKSHQQLLEIDPPNMENRLSKCRKIDLERTKKHSKQIKTRTVKSHACMDFYH